MATKININLEKHTFDLELQGISLNGISHLSTMVNTVADTFKGSLLLLGVTPDKADEATTLLLQGTYDIEYILKSVL